YNQAIIEITQLKQSILSNQQKAYNSLHTRHTLNYALMKYVDYIHNKNGYESDIQNTKQHIEDCKRVIYRFYESLNLSGIDTSIEKTDMLSVDCLSPFYTLIKNKYKVKCQATIDRHTR